MVSIARSYSDGLEVGGQNWVRGTYELRGILLGIVAGEIATRVDKVKEISRREVLLSHR
jgi:hypothetical protein